MINRYIGHHNIKQVIHSIEEACKIYYVKLIKGKSFYAFDHRYLVSEEEEVSEKIYNYLRRNEFFEVRKEEYSA
ncbi:hypothetical protein bcere0024_012030 [Bacillus cereus Rock4-18]|nr:hypothetical protein bcere0019_26490 [Bacillus cereus Rock3-28]PKR93102.1 hypothetical protein bcere0024_012030 [Bacillus cereus Rock4-18]